jgi:hypothetical protein
MDLSLPEIINKKKQNKRNIKIKFSLDKREINMINFELDEFHTYHESSEINKHLGNVDWYKIKFNNPDIDDIDDYVEFSDLVEKTKNIKIHKIKVKTVGGVLDCLKVLCGGNSIYCANAEHAAFVRKSCFEKSNNLEKYIYCIVWEDDIAGVQVLETHKITSEEYLNKLEDFIMGNSQ